MHSRRSKVVVIAGLSAFVILVAGIGLSLRGPVREWQNISRLSSPDDAVRIAATERLLELKSVAAILALMKSLDRDLRSVFGKRAEQFFENMRTECAELELKEQSVSAIEKKLLGIMGMPPAARKDLQDRLRRLRSELANRYSRTVRRGFRSLLSYRTVNRIPRETYPAVLPKLRRWLHSHDWHTRWITAHLVIDLRLPDAATSLQELALDEDELVRHTAKAGLWMFSELDKRRSGPPAARTRTRTGRRRF